MGFPEDLCGTPAYSFKDIRVGERYANFDKNDAILKTDLTREIKLKRPLVSAAMDTVTGWRMAASIAREGGFGIIHPNLTIQEQVEEVIKVKRAQTFVIPDPVTIGPDVTLAELRALRAQAEKRKEDLPGSWLVIDEGRHLLGIVTKRDMARRLPGSLKVMEFMTRREDVITARPNITLNTAQRKLDEIKKEKLPLVDKNNVVVGLITSRDLENSDNFPYAVTDSQRRLLVGAAIGPFEYMERVEALLKAGANAICIDSSKGAWFRVVNAVKEIKSAFPDAQVIAGNVAEPDGTLRLIKAGADAIKVGIGPGSICKTYTVSGGGMPQFSAIKECAEVARKYGIPIIADGGITDPGDLAKALLYADTVMLGKLFAQAEESAGKVKYNDGVKMKEYRGMGSVESMVEGSIQRYGEKAIVDPDLMVPEGVPSLVLCIGPLSKIVYQLDGGIKSGMWRAGCKTIPLLHKRGYWRVQTPAGHNEGNVHDVRVTENLMVA